MEKRFNAIILAVLLFFLLYPYINSILTGYPILGIPDIKKSCGNNRVDRGEICDGTNLKGKDCFDLGYIGGVLKCSSNCLSYDTSSCTSSNPPQCSDEADNDGDTLVD